MLVVTLAVIILLFLENCDAELLRVLRRLSMKEQWTDLSLQYLTRRTLQLLLADNTRNQNHFRSIGGLEVLLDGLGIPPSNAWKIEDHSFGKMVR